MESKCFSCKNKNVKTSYGYTVCNYSGSECRNFELYDPIKKTNADRIRSMSDEELAELFADNDCGYCSIHDFCFAKGCQINCEDVWLDWLREDATDG